MSQCSGMSHVDDISQQGYLSDRDGDRPHDGNYINTINI